MVQKHRTREKVPASANRRKGKRSLRGTFESNQEIDRVLGEGKARTLSQCSAKARKERAMCLRCEFISKQNHMMSQNVQLSRGASSAIPKELQDEILTVVLATNGNIAAAQRHETKPNEF
jgi:hypothetical protein